MDVYDPWISAEEAGNEYGITPLAALCEGVYDGIIIAVAHHQFRSMGAQAIHALGRERHVLYDLKYVLPNDAADLRL